MLSTRRTSTFCTGLVFALSFALGRLTAQPPRSSRPAHRSTDYATTGADVHNTSGVQCYARRMCPSVLRGSRLSADYDDFFKKFGGDRTRYSYHTYLTQNSLVVEVGGYTGVDIKKMRQLHGPFKTLLFEPVFHDEARLNLDGLDVVVYPYGLGATTRSTAFKIKGDATRPTKRGTLAEIRQVSDVISELDITHVDLLQINCEGCEWEVLESVLKAEQCHIFHHIQVQFHAGVDWVENRLERYAIIQDRLTETHELLYDQPWIWQLWRSKSY